MAINFPNSPSVNDIHVSGANRWQWNGSSWTRIGGVNSDSDSINSTNDNSTTTLYPVMVSGTGDQTAKIATSATKNISFDASDGNLTVGGNISVGGTITYEDVTNVDSVGVVTARAGVIVTGNLDTDTLNVSGVSTVTGLGATDISVSGIVTAASGQLISGVGIDTSGTVVGYAATIIHFRGPGVSTAYYSATTGIGTVYFQGGGGSASVSISESAPSSPSAGDMWWDSDVGNLQIYYTDANSSQWVTANNSGPAGAQGAVGAQGAAGAVGAQGAIGYASTNYIHAQTLAVVGVSTFHDHVHLKDDKNLYFGDGNDGYIYWDGSNFSIRGSGPTYLRGSQVKISANGGSGGFWERIKVTSDEVELYYGSDQLRLKTTSGGLQLNGDVSIADKIVHTGDTNTAIRFPAADTITAETGGSERLRIASGGNVGINTDFTGSQTWRNGQRLEIFGGGGNVTGELHLGANRGDSNQSVGSINFFDNSQDSTHRHIALIEADKSGSTSNKRGGDLIFFTKKDNTAAPNEKLRIASNGNIGINQSNPGDLLEINPASNNDGLTIKSTGAIYPAITGNTNRTGADEFLLNIRGMWNNTTVANILLETGDDTTNKDNGVITFRTASAGSPAERLRINSTGGVKIGSGSATGIHNLAKVLEISGGDGGDLIIGNDVSANIGAGAHIGAIAFKNIDTSTGSAPHYAGIRCEATDTSGNMDLRFYTGITNLESDTPQVLINNIGKVGIEKTSPESKLTVYSTERHIQQLEAQTGITAGTTSGTIYRQQYTTTAGSSRRMGFFGIKRIGGTGDQRANFVMEMCPDNSTNIGLSAPASSTTAFEFQTNGQMWVKNGGGIDFSDDSNPHSGMTNELLDDYEEGNLTWYLRKSDNTSGGNDNGSLVKYTKVGRLVHISGRIRTDSVSSGSNYVFHLDGSLPFTPSTSGTSVVGHWRSQDQLDNSLTASISWVSGSTTIYLYTIDSKSDYTANTNNVPASHQTNLVMTFSFTYQAT